MYNDDEDDESYYTRNCTRDNSRYLILQFTDRRNFTKLTGTENIRRTAKWTQMSRQYWPSYSSCRLRCSYSYKRQQLQSNAVCSVLLMDLYILAPCTAETAATGLSQLLLHYCQPPVVSRLRVNRPSYISKCYISRTPWAGAPGTGIRPGCGAVRWTPVAKRATWLL